MFRCKYQVGVDRFVTRLVWLAVNRNFLLTLLDSIFLLEFRVMRVEFRPQLDSYFSELTVKYSEKYEYFI